MPSDVILSELISQSGELAGHVLELVLGGLGADRIWGLRPLQVREFNFVSSPSELSPGGLINSEQIIKDLF